jgi:hypothetical protein
VVCKALGGDLEGIIEIEGPHKAKLKVTMVLVTTFHNNLIACNVLWLFYLKKLGYSLCTYHVEALKKPKSSLALGRN